MKQITFAIVAFATVAVSCQNSKYTGDCKLKNNVDSVSYALGYFEASGLNQMMARMPFDTLDASAFAKAFAISSLSEEYMENRKQQFDTLDAESFMFGFTHQLKFKKGKFDDTMADVLCRNKFDEVRARKQNEQEMKAAKALIEGETFLAENAKNEGVVVLESGVQYKVLTAGTGAKPKLSDRVKCHYHGTLIDGTVFDSSVERGEPIDFAVTGVIKGWTEVLQLMPVGSKWTVYIPSALAYGERGSGDKIVPNSTLIFDIELIDIVK